MKCFNKTVGLTNSRPNYLTLKLTISTCCNDSNYTKMEYPIYEERTCHFYIAETMSFVSIEREVCSAKHNSRE